MPNIMFKIPRLFFDGLLSDGAQLEAGREQANYLRNVLRLPVNADVLVFNGRDGEWMARTRYEGRRQCALDVVSQTRVQTPSNNLHYLFAPLKHARLDYMVQKAVEMGAGILQPVMTQHTQVTRVNEERMRANVIEASEQCGVLSIPAVAPVEKLNAVLEKWPQDRLLIFCDEDEPVADPVELLRSRATGAGKPCSSVTLLVGPEGGFSPDERERIRNVPGSVTISLGPRILRADTAAVAALTVVQTALGDWRG